MSNVYQMKSVTLTPKRSGGEPPMTTLEQRVSHLETNVTEIKTDIKEMRKDLTTFQMETIREFGKLREETATEFGKVKSEMHSLARQTIMWNIGTVFTAVGLVFAIMRYLN